MKGILLILAGLMLLRERVDLGATAASQEEAPGDTSVFIAPLEAWGVKRVSGNPKDVEIQEIGVVKWRLGEGQHRDNVLRIRCRWSGGTQGSNIELQLTDEHGCDFFNQKFFDSTRQEYLYFENWPRDGMKLLIWDITQPVPGETVKSLVGTFTLQHPGPVQGADWNAESLPQRRHLGQATVELTSLDEHWHPKFRIFDQSGNPQANWIEDHWEIEDRHGNTSSTFRPICRQEILIKLRGYFRQTTNAAFAPDEVAEITIPEIPGAGKFTPMDWVQERRGAKVIAYAVAGTGEFTYEKGKIVHATESFGARVPHPRRVEGDVFLKEWSVKRSLRTGAPISPIVVVSKVPHVAIQIHGLKPGQWWHIEGMTDARRAYHLAPESEAEFVPLRYAPGTKNVKIRIVIQESQTAEWIVNPPMWKEPGLRIPVLRALDFLRAPDSN